MSTVLYPIGDVIVEGRHRKDLGDIDTLAASIDSIGLLHPIVVTTDGRLVAGQRRLEACKKLGRTKIAVTEVANLSDASALLIAERDENTCREDMKPSERVAIGRALEELERPDARRRMEAGGPSENFTEGRKGDTRDIVGGAVGWSGVTYQRARAVVEASEDESLPGEARIVAAEAVEEMDRTGKVTPAYNKVATVTNRSQTHAPKNGKKDEPYEPVTKRQHELANAQRARLVTALSSIDGYCQGLAKIDMQMAFAECSVEEREAWAKQATKHSRQLRELAKTLKPENVNV